MITAIELLKKYESWEARLIEDNECWENGFPVIKHDYFDEFLELQELRNKVLNTENTEVVSSAQSESIGLHDVRESHASGDTEQPQALVEGALEKITNTERAICRNPTRCYCCNIPSHKKDCTFYW